MVSKRIWPLGALLIFIWNSKSITVILTTNLWPMLVLSKNVSTQKIRSERMKPLHYSIPLPNGLIKFPGNIQVLPRKFTSEPLDFWNVVSTWISMNNDSGYIKYGRWICQTSSWFNTSIKECPVRNWFITDRWILKFSNWMLASWDFQPSGSRSSGFWSAWWIHE